MVASADPQQPAHTEASGGFLNGADPLESPVGLFLLQVVIIMATTRVLAAVLHRLKQPRVIAEILAGIILGPSGLGNIPGWLDHVFPKRSLPYLSLVANVGLVLYMYVVGLELNPTTLFHNAKHTLAISATGIVVPFLLGSAGSVVLYQHQRQRLEDEKAQGHDVKDVPFASFVLFTGLSMSITAFPVLGGCVGGCLKCFHQRVDIIRFIHKQTTQYFHSPHLDRPEPGRYGSGRADDRLGGHRRRRGLVPAHPGHLHSALHQHGHGALRLPGGA